MDVMQAISERRSIRQFQDKPVSKELIEAMLEAAIKAPSGKNAQPWRFVVLEGPKKDEVVDILTARVATLNAEGVKTGSAENSARIMRQAPVLIVIFDPYLTAEQDHNGWTRISSLVHTQSVGAAIQNLLLAATSAGLGTLWICDVLTAEKEIGELLGVKEELVAAVSLGYAGESPAPRARKPLQEVTKWVE